jgi:hypothetical protein
MSEDLAKRHRDLRALAGRTVRLQFDDGHVVIAKLLDVADLGEQNEIVYDEPQVLVAGTQRFAYDGRSAFAAHFASLTDFALVDE